MTPSKLVPHQALRALPLHLKQFRRETDDSYRRRLLDAHRLTPNARRRGDLSRWTAARTLAVIAPWRRTNTEAEERQRAVDERHLDTRRRWMCRLCAAGEEVELRSHFGDNVCLRHRLWIGPGVPPADQVHVTDSVVAAELRFRRLRNRRRLHGDLYVELLEAVAEHRRTQSDQAADPAADDYPALISLLADVILNQEFIHLLLSPHRSYGEAYDLLQSAVAACLGADAPVVVDTIWLLLRPGFARARRMLDGYPPDPLTLPDSRAPHLNYTPPTSYPRPLAPFDRYLAQRRTCAARRLIDDDHAYLTETRRRPGDMGRRKRLALCSKGHFCMMHTPIATRSSRRSGIGCPVCGNDRALAGYNTIRVTDPGRLSEWHPTKNPGLTPDDVTRWNDTINIWWRCENGHEFNESALERMRRSTCAYCRNLRIDPKVNSLAATHPEIAAQWHPTFNGDLTPSKVAAGSRRRVWWLCSAGHSWASRIEQRPRNNTGCRYCREKTVSVGHTDLATTHPDLAREIHPENALKAHELSARHQTQVLWLCPQGHRYLCSPRHRARGTGCSICASHVLPLATISGVGVSRHWKPPARSLSETHPELATQWHPTYNGGLRPSHFSADASAFIWWLCDNGHHFEAPIKERSLNRWSCSYCRGRRVWPGFNDLQTKRPDLAAEWDPDGNNGLAPSQVLAGSARKYQWLCPNGHPAYKQAMGERLKGARCPVCTKQRILPGVNDFASRRPDLLYDWDYDRNDQDPRTIGIGSTKKFHWRCRNGHQLFASPQNRATSAGCTACPGTSRAGTTVGNAAGSSR